MVVLKESVYDAIVDDIKNFHGLSRNCKEYLENKYPETPNFTIGSILSAQWQARMKSSYRHWSNSKKKYYNMYKKAIDNGEPPGIMIRMSVQLNMSPSLLASSILKHVNPNKRSIKKQLKDTTLITDRYIAYEVYLCNLYDNDYGHLGNIIKMTIGKEYEQRLEFELKKLNVAYIDEDVLRSKGYDKTPDVKLVVPIAIDGFVINWIESKALFGDEQSHAGYLKDQLLCYWNRFGPGLIIYWFGYIETLENTAENNNTIILRDKFPDLKSITFMEPCLIDE